LYIAPANVYGNYALADVELIAVAMPVLVMLLMNGGNSGSTSLVLKKIYMYFLCF